MSRKPTVQQCRKSYDAKCFLCREADYTVLDAHRIVPGERGGVYTWTNLVTLCSNCHRKVTAGAIRIHSRLTGTRGPVIHWTDESGAEHFTNENEARHGPVTGEHGGQCE